MSYIRLLVQHPREVMLTELMEEGRVPDGPRKHDDANPSWLANPRGVIETVDVVSL